MQFNVEAQHSSPGPSLHERHGFSHFADPHGPVQVLVQSLGGVKVLRNGLVLHDLLSDIGADKDVRSLLEHHRVVLIVQPAVWALDRGVVVITDTLPDRVWDLGPVPNLRWVKYTEIGSERHMVSRQLENRVHINEH